MTDSEAELRERVDDIIGDARNEAYQAGDNDTNMDLHDYTEDIMSLLANHTKTVELAARASQLQELLQYWETVKLDTRYDVGKTAGYVHELLAIIQAKPGARA